MRHEYRITNVAQIDEADALHAFGRLPRGYERKPRLADPAEPGHRHEPRLAEQALDVLEFPLAADEAGERDGQVVPSSWRRDVRNLVSQDRPVQVTQIVPRLEPELAREPVSCPAIGSQRLRLAAGPVQREHELAPEPLT